MKKKLLWVMGITVIVLISVAVIGFNYTGSYTSQFTGPVSTNEPLPRILISDLEKYVGAVNETNGCPWLIHGTGRG
jgi:hypothetical protein